MKSITIKINTENAAFEGLDDGLTEVARILKEIAGKLENGSTPDKLRDLNGNTVGTVTIK